MKFIYFIFCYLSIWNLLAQDKTPNKNQPIELGKVQWLRDYDEAIIKSQDQKKPIMILFQEVPGCATCQGYGKGALSHPLMVEVIENLFIPLVIYNNKGGKDGEVLKLYNEPSWNNPVVRIVDERGNNVVSRLSGDYSPLGLYKTLFNAMIKQNRPIPEYMKLLGEELSAINGQNMQEKTYQMYCFWSGEKHLGALDGVLSTATGFVDGHEVVKVVYDTKCLNEEQLNRYAKKGNCQPINTSIHYLNANDDHLFYLKQTAFKYLPLTELQKTKINSALGSQQAADQYLSPRQLHWLKQIRNGTNKKPLLYNWDFEIAWVTIEGNKSIKSHH